MPNPVTITLYPKVPVTRPRAEGSVVSVNFGWELLSVLTDPDEGLAVHDPDAKKGDAGYVVAAPVPGPRSNAAAQPTRVVALDYDDSPTGPNWAALESFRHVAYTTDSHTDAEPRWRVWVLLDRAYSAEEVGRAVVPAELAGAHLRAISQPVFLPTKADDLVWQVGPETAPPLVLADWWAPAGPAEPGPGTAGDWTPPTRVTRPSQASTNALVTRWLSRPEGTNRLAGALGACLAEWGWSDEDVRGYVDAWFGQADPKVRKHADDAVRGARKRRAGDRIVGFPTLAEELGQAFEAERLAGADDVVEEVLRAVAAEPPGAGPAPDDPDGLWASVEAGAGAAPAELLGARVWTARDIAAWDPPPIAWLSEELCLAPGAPALITGYGGSGKTTFVQHLAVAVATPGVRLLGEFSVRHGSVLHVDHEQGTDLTLRRYRRLGLRADSQLDLVSFPRWSLGDVSPEARAAFVRACAGRALVVVDSLLASCAAFLEDENASAVREPLDFLGRVSQATGAVFLVIHHSKKDRTERMTSARGSSAITDAVSVHITYEKADLSPRTNPVLELGKVRYEPPARALDEPVTVVFQPRGVPADGGYSLAVGASAEDPEQNTPANSLETRIITELADGVPKSFNQLARTIQVNRNTLSATVKTMVQEKTLEKTPDGLTLGGIRV